MKSDWTSPYKNTATGSIVMLTMAMLLAMTTQVLLLGLVISRSLTQESVYSSQSVAAKSAAETGLERLHQALLAYAQTTTPTSTNVLANYGSGQASALTNVTLSAKNPETGVSASLPVTVTAYVNQARGNFYELVSTATYRDVVITDRKWIQLDKCQASSSASTPTVLLTNAGSGDARIYVDSINNRAIISDSARTLLYRNTTLLTTLFASNKIRSYVLDPTSGNIFFLRQGTNEVYYLKPDNTLLSIPALALFNSNSVTDLVVNPSTGVMYLYRDPSTSTLRGLWSYNPTTGTSTQLATFTINWAGGANGTRLKLNPNTGRIFIGGSGYTTQPLYTWAPATGLTSLANGYRVGDTMVVNPNTDRVIFGELNETPHGWSRIFSWSPSGGLTTLLDNAVIYFNNGFSVDVSRDRYYWAEGDGASLFNFKTWSPSVGISTLRTGVTVSYQIAFQSVVDPASGQYIFPDTNGLKVLAYQPDTNSITTLPAGAYRQIGGFNAYNVTPQLLNPLENNFNRVFEWLGSDDSYNFFQNSNRSSVYTPSTRGVFIGTANNLLWWHPTAGLTTLLTATGANPGVANGNIVSDPSTGNTFIGTDGPTDYFYIPSQNRVISLPGAGDNDDTGHYNNVNFNTGRIYFMKGVGTSIRTIYTTVVGSNACD